MFWNNNAKGNLIPFLLLSILVVPFSASYPLSLEEVMARDAFLDPQVAQPGYWRGVVQNQQDQAYLPMHLLEPVPIKRGTWKRNPRYVSNYADAVFRGLG